MDNNSSPNSGLKKSMGVLFAALLVFGAVAGALAYLPKANAQAVLITTSSNTFYGNSYLQVIINDAAKNSASTTQETTAVTVTIKDDTGATKAGPASISAEEIGTNSGQFEFFVTPVKATATANNNPSSPRSLGPVFDTIAKIAVARFGNGYTGTSGTGTDAGDANDLVLNTGTNPANNWKVEIEYAGQVKTVNFATSTAQFNLDRETAGSTNVVRYIITDQDANLDPTKADTIQGASDTSKIVIDADDGGGGDVDSGEKTLITGSFTAGSGTNRDFVETGPNTGVFELSITQGTVTTTSTSSYQFADFDVYEDDGGAFSITETTSTITRTLILQNIDGSISPISSITFGGELTIAVNDADRNINSRTEDTITATPIGTTLAQGVRVSVDTTTGTADAVAVNLKETGQNTGVFAADLTDGKLPVTFVDSNSGISTSDSILQITVAQLEGNPDIIIEYFDTARADGATAAVTSRLRVPISHAAGIITFDQSKAQLTDKVSITLNDMDLNNNAKAKDSYTFTTSTTSGSIEYNIAGTNVGSTIATFTLKIKGSSTQASGTAQTVTLIETGDNTGLFTGTLDIAKVNPGGSSALADGDQIELTYKDKMESPDVESSTTLNIGKPSTAVTVDRTTVPVPLKSSEPSAVVGGTPSADSVKFRLTITDPSLNTDSAVQNTLAATTVDQGSSTHDIKLTTSTGTTTLTIDTTGAVDITYSGFPLTETGPNTGVFSGMITLTRGTATSSTLANLDNAKLTITYDGNTATVTLRPTDLVITTSNTIVRNGDAMNVTITDLDRNLDSETKDTITFTVATQNDAITTTGTFTGTAEETGVNTGIFTKRIVIGTDIRVTSVGTSVTQATELKITATDRVATDRSSPDRDLTIRVGTTTGSISVTPEVVGPGTKLSILVKDSDLNINPAGVDLVPSTGTNTEYVSVTTDRSNFPTTKVAGEETSSNSGEFKTTIKLKPKTTADTVAPATPSGTKDLTNFEVKPGDLISIKYIDTKDANGNKVTISKIVKVTSVDPEMTPGKSSYAVGESISLTIADIDANTDGEAVDSVKVRVTSTSDPVGFDITGLETGPNTGVFSFSVPSTNSVSSGAITVKNGDNASFKYTDTYPADYADRVKQVADPSKDFVLNIPIGAGTDNRSTTPSAPALKDAQGNAVSQVLAGQQVVLSTTVKNNEAGATSYAAIVEVRDSNGITVYLNWQTGTLQANGETGIGLSWTPDAPGTYTARVFVLSDLTNPRILSETVTSNINVS